MRPGASCVNVCTTMFRTSYAVLWQEGDGPVNAGKLVLCRSSLRLETGAGRDRATSKVFRYEELTAVGSAAPVDRVRSRPTALVDRVDRDRLAIAAVDGIGSMHEIVERLTAQLRLRVDS
jgi:hypothetical protein